MARAGLVVVGVADLLCPERCAACPAVVVSTSLFCAECAAEINVLGAPECDACGAPSLTSPCTACAAGVPSPIRRARAWAAYRGADDGTGPIARAVAAYKYGPTRRLGRRFAAAMLSRVPDAAVECVVPVPLHPARLRARGFNQSAVMARHLARALTRRCVLTALRRVRDTPSQTALSAAARATNVADAFLVETAHAIAGAAVLLVDDVWTSGATVRAAAAALRDGGAVTVDVLTFARVL